MNDNKDKIKIRRYLDNLYTRQEGLKIIDTLNNPKNNKLVNRISAKIWEESGEQPFSDDLVLAEYKEEARNLLNNVDHKKRLWLYRFTAIIATSAAIFLTVFISNYYIKEKKIRTSYAEVSTSFGEKKHLTLSDGTKITLNSCSHIYYPTKFNGNIRRVKLYGEAFFEVSHNKQKPFIVTTPSFCIRVLGTKFDLKTYQHDEKVSVGVRTGKVKVTLPEASVNISSNEEFTYNTLTKEFSKKRGNQETAVWINGRTLQFNCTPIRDAAKELERIYHCHITFAKGERFNNLISGEHDNKNLGSVLKSISFITGNIKYDIEGNNVFFYHQ